MFILTKKLQILQKNIRVWNEEDNFIHDPDDMARYVVNHFSNIFHFLDSSHDSNMVDEVNPTFTDSSMNNLLTIFPSKDEISNVIHNRNKYSAPSPDNFGGIFFHTYWSIIKEDVCNVVIQFFRIGWMLPNYNANKIIIIPKVKDVDSIDKFRPLALMKFMFKIISKILADRHASIMHSIVSKEQRGFILVRSMRDCTCLASEVVNVL